MSDYKYLLVEKKDKVGIITMYNPPENRIVLSMLKELRDAFSRFDQDEEVLFIMLKGKGESFSRGGSVEFINNLEDWETIEFFQNVADTGIAVRNIKKPTMAVVDGWATAAGGVMANACDLVVASENAAFGATAVNFGLLCFFAPAVLLPILGYKKAFEYIMTGDLIDPFEAERRGLINKVVPRDKLEEAAWELANKIIAKSPSVIIAGKRSLKASIGLDYDRAMILGAASMVSYQMTADAKEGMTAFLENREADYKICGTRGDFSVIRKR